MCALVHSIKPSLIPWDSLNRSDELGNLNLAFDAAEKIGVPRLLDAEDMTPGPPEPFSVTTYLGTFYHAAQKFEASGNKEPERPKPTAAATPARNATSNAPNLPARDNNMKENIAPVSVGPNCCKCSKPAQGSMIDWSGNLYHQDCFKCAGCNRGFRNTCLNIEGLPYCDTCGRKAFVKSRLIRAGRETENSNSTPSPAAAPALPPKDEPSAHVRTNSATSQLKTPATTSPKTSVSSATSPSISTTSTTKAPALPAKNEPTSHVRTPSASSQAKTNSTAVGTSNVTKTSVSEKPSPTAAAPALPPKNEPSSTTTTTSSGVQAKTTSSIAARAASFAPKPASPQTASPAAAPALPPKNEPAVPPKATSTLSQPKPTSSVGARSASVAPSWTSRNQSPSTTAASNTSTTSSNTYTSTSTSTSSNSTIQSKDSPKMASTNAAPALPKPNESIVEREMREQREKEAELAAARERARGVSVASSPSTAASPSTTTTSISSTHTSNASTTYKASTLGAPSATGSKGITKAKTVSSTLPTQPAASTTSHSTQAPKKESIIEKEMREQREKEEQLARDRGRATSPSVASTAASKPSVGTSAPPLPDRVASPPPTLPPKNTVDSAPMEPSKNPFMPKPLRPVSPPVVQATNVSSSNTSSYTNGHLKSGPPSPRKATGELEPPRLPSRTPSPPTTAAPALPARNAAEEYNKPLPPAPSRPQSLAPHMIASSSQASSSSPPVLPPRDYTLGSAVSASVVASSSNATNDIAEDISESENEAPEVREKMKRATRTLRRINVTRVEQGTKGFLKRRDKSLFWTTQWFSLQDYRLLFYDKAQSKFSLAAEHPPQGFFSLQFVEEIKYTEGKKAFTLDGGAAYGKVDFKASSAEEAADWVTSINDAITLYRATTRDEDIRKSSKPVFGQEHAEDWVMSGTLQRLTPKGTFSSNWWLLQDGMLFYFAQEGGKRLGRIPLFHCEFAPFEMEPGNSKAPIRAFCITTHTGEKVVLCASDEMEMHRWLNCRLRQRIVIEEAINTISF